MRGSSGPFRPAHPSVTVRAVKHYWWEAELASSVPRQRSTYTPFGQRLSEAGSTLPATPSASKPEGAAKAAGAQTGPWGHHWDRGAAWYVLTGCRLPAGRRAWCLLTRWFSIRHELCHSPTRWCPSKSRQICCFLTATTLLRHALSFEICFKSCFFLNFSNFFFTTLL